MSARHDVVVVGAGLAGLACALRLTRHGLDVVVLEAGDAVGGRVRTDHVDGFTLDRGFQVLNTGYPELPRVLDLPALDLRFFEPGAVVRMHGRPVAVSHPLRRPLSAASLVGLPAGGLGGKVALGAYAARCAVGPADGLKEREDVPASAAWQHARVPEDLVDGLLKPFFSGVLLEQDMSTSRRFTDLMMRMFARGRSAVPSLGMQRMPEQLASGLPPGSVRLSTRVHRVAAESVETSEGPVAARSVVVAADPWGATELLPHLLAEPSPRGVTTVYHSLPHDPSRTGTLLLDADGSPVANTVVISAAAPSYAPAGRDLVSTSLVHGSGPVPDPDGPEVRAALARLHGTDTSRWEHVATYSLPHALPGMPAPHPLRSPVRFVGGSERMYVAGDHRDTSSIQGALVSGRRAADAVLSDLGVP